MSALQSLLLALSFLTRLPVQRIARGRLAAPQPSGAQLGAAVGFFPWVGGLIGGLLWLTAELLSEPLGSQLTAAGVVALGAVITGGLHLDGLADLFDAAGGGRGDRARMLEIMRDPRIGAHGASALVLVLLAKVLASAELCAHGPLAALFLAPVVGRFGAAALIRGFAYARPDGLGRSFHDHVRGRDLAIACAGLALALLIAGLSLSASVLAGLLVALLTAAYAQRRLGGLTGDVHGAAIELAELCVLIAATL